VACSRANFTFTFTFMQGCTRILVINQFLVVAAHYNPASYMIAVFSSEIILYQNSNHITDDCQVLFEVFFLIDE